MCVCVCVVNRFRANFGQKLANEIKAYRKQLLPMLPVSKRGRTVVVARTCSAAATAFAAFAFRGRGTLVVGMCAAASSWQ